MSSNIRILIKINYICPIFYFIREIIPRINFIKSRFILRIVCISKFVNGCGGIKKIFKNEDLLELLPTLAVPSPALINPLPNNISPNKLHLMCLIAY